MGGWFELKFIHSVIMLWVFNLLCRNAGTNVISSIILVFMVSADKPTQLGLITDFVRTKSYKQQLPSFSTLSLLA